MFSERKKQPENKPLDAKNAKMAERVNVTKSYFKILGIWIKMIIKKELTRLAKYEGSSVYRERPKGPKTLG